MSQRIVVDLSERTLTLLRDGEVLRRYPVGVGKPATPTPAGEFQIIEKARVTDPRFGTRWMELSAPGGGIGIHGTYNTASIGRAVSNGCIRMRVADVQELYDLVPVGTPVTVRR